MKVSKVNQLRFNSFVNQRLLWISYISGDLFLRVHFQVKEIDRWRVQDQLKSRLTVWRLFDKMIPFQRGSEMSKKNNIRKIRAISELLLFSENHEQLRNNLNSERSYLGKREMVRFTCHSPSFQLVAYSSIMENSSESWGLLTRADAFEGIHAHVCVPSPRDEE